MYSLKRPGKLYVVQLNLGREQVCTVGDILANRTSFEVEFSDRDARTYESIGLRPE